MASKLGRLAFSYRKKSK